jgi:intein-encoded DNA endonuclease-like protein
MSTKHNGKATVVEAAKFLHVGPETVRRYIRENKLKADKERAVGLKEVWMVPWDELKRFNGA